MTQPYYHDRQQFGGPAKPKRRAWPWILAAIVALCAFGGVATTLGSNGNTPAVTVAASDEPTAAGTTAQHAAATAKPATVKAGSWEVGTEVKPGTYTTTAGDDAHCYWARLKSFDGDFDAIIANGNLDPGEHGRVTVKKKTDKGLELTGDCAWKAAK